MDILVIGGGFYGCSIALMKKRAEPARRVVLLERDSGMLTRASYNNQARVHNGYHYPRSFTTAYRSRVNYRRFLADYEDCIERNFTKIYAVARHNSLVTAGQFARFCREINAPAKPTDRFHKLFSQRHIEAVFEVEECAFNAVRLAEQLARQMEEAGVEVGTNTEVTEVEAEDGAIRVVAQGPDGPLEYQTRYLFNCTYAGLNRLSQHLGVVSRGLKYEVTEMALVEPPEELANVGVTVMDGPFFSVMPFPPRGLHTLSHVRYTPHGSWIGSEHPDWDPYQVLEECRNHSNFSRMVRDATRYMPCLASTRQVDSLFEIKMLLAASETDDSRAILLDPSARIPGAYSVLGGKIDNIYDIFEAVKVHFSHAYP